MTALATIAHTGLQAAQLRLDASAHNVAALPAPGAQRLAVAQQAAPGLGGVQAQVQRLPQGAPALEAEAVEQIAASYAFRANVLALRTAHETLGTLLDVYA